ncbi:PTS sugar transporter subunit IIA [Streptobacillus felis]|uniref:PTS sugar transporter subunit IIA n=1 Tax=Streptobacillus felis TaxID=1384509 RepID=A0A7Z0PFY5_9FUSO|nr:PTS sugar transporter subunit IIA [Streptobacillus felis]NYV27842.1 PTS sugar transporter subunit IIA [Streptobacillus felis]
MRIVEKENIIINHEIEIKEEIIENMINTLKLSEDISKKIKEEVIKREEIENTVLGFRFAVPHSKSKYIDETKVIYLKSKKDLVWDDDEEEINHVFMILVPESNPEKHIDILKDISTKIINSEFRSKLNELEDKNEIEKILNS